MVVLKMTITKGFFYRFCALQWKNHNIKFITNNDYYIVVSCVSDLQLNLYNMCSELDIFTDLCNITLAIATL